MLDSLRRSIDAEPEQLEELFDTFGSLLERGRDDAPGPVDVLALSGLLHSFYNGVESIMKRIAREVDEQVPRGDAWHTQLLEQMSRATDRRAAVLSKPMRERLMEYVGFRHRFRLIYGHMLRYDIMRHLVLGCRETLDVLSEELHTFMAGLAEDGDA